jgi:hypothetical protein
MFNERENYINSEQFTLIGVQISQLRMRRHWRLVQNVGTSGHWLKNLEKLCFCLLLKLRMVEKQ